MTNTATVPEVDPNHPDGTDPNGDSAESKPTTETAPTKRRKQTKYEQIDGLVGLKLPGGDETYLNDNGRFRVGYDAKLKSRLVGEQLDIEAEADATPEGTERPDTTATDQYQMLSALGWLSSLDASRSARKARKDRKAASKAPADPGSPTHPDAGTADRIEQGKANKAAAHAFVDKAVTVKVGRRDRLGRVLRVKRTDDQDILSAWVAEVAVPDDPRRDDSPITEHRVPVAELRLA